MRAAALVLGTWFALAQVALWTDCAEGAFCRDKDRCADACDERGCGPCEERSCLHVEPQGDVAGAEPLPDLSTSFLALDEVLPAPALVRADGVAAGGEGLPPPARGRPYYLSQRSFLS